MYNPGRVLIIPKYKTRLKSLTGKNHLVELYRASRTKEKSFMTFRPKNQREHEIFKNTF
jgi:hypothetical protein